MEKRSFTIESRRAHGVTVVEVPDVWEEMTESLTLLLDGTQCLMRMQRKYLHEAPYKKVCYTMMGELPDAELAGLEEQIRRLSVTPFDSLRGEVMKIIDKHLEERRYED